MKNTFIFVSSFVIVAALVGLVFKVADNVTQTKPVMCTMEAKMCPDGSYVGRSGPKCEFTACPDTISNSKEVGILQGSMTIGPICPVERVDHPCTPTPEMYAARKVFVYNSDHTKTIATLTPNADGHFSATLPAGDYIVDTEHQSIGFSKGSPQTIKIITEKTTTVVIDIDTGIR